MTGRMFSIATIFIIASISWFWLGDNLRSRTNESEEQLASKVQTLWGEEQRQKAPEALCSYERPPAHVSPYAAETPATATEPKVFDWATRQVELSSSKITADFDMDYRRKGLIWYNTYTVLFNAAYTLKNETPHEAHCTISLTLPSSNAIYSDFTFTVHGAPLKEFLPVDNILKHDQIVLKPGQTTTINVSYNTRGLNNWLYVFGRATDLKKAETDEEHEQNDDTAITRVRNLDFVMTTKFKKIDYPPGTLSPTTKENHGSGWKLTWKTPNLITGFNIGMGMPEKLNPGPLAGQICSFAPLSLLFFFLVIFIVCLMRNIELHPINYLFLSAAFFSFHLLMAYLADHIDIGPAFAVSSVVSVFLVVSYLRIVVGARFAIVEAGGAQLIYLVLFSYAHFFTGYTGLSITIVSILTLFVMMQLTAKIKWADKFNRPGPSLPRVAFITQQQPQAAPAPNQNPSPAATSPDDV